MIAKLKRKAMSIEKRKSFPFVMAEPRFVIAQQTPRHLLADLGPILFGASNNAKEQTHDSYFAFYSLD